MKLGIALLSLATVFSAVAFSEIDEHQEFSGWLRDGYLHHTSYIPSEDGELFSNPCPVCGTFESDVSAFCVNRPSWDNEADNDMDCDIEVQAKISGTWQTVDYSTSSSNEEYVNCGTTCEDRYVRVRVYDYNQDNSGVVGIRFGKGHD